MPPVKNVKGRRFKRLKVIGPSGTRAANGGILWTCLCDCGNTCAVISGDLIRGHSTSCGCARRGATSPKWKGYALISQTFMRRLTYWMEKRIGHIPKNMVTKQYLWNLYVKQDKKCAFSGLPIFMGIEKGHRVRTASLDRIDSSKGYVRGNVQWVHKRINMMKSNQKDSHFIELCKLVAKHSGNRGLSV